MAESNQDGKTKAQEYDAQHGDPAKNADFAKLVDLGEGQNKPAPHEVPFKITNQG